MNHDSTTDAAIAQIASHDDNQLGDDASFSPEQHQQQDGATKRKAGDGGAQPQQRAKRNRYISIACNECKRRKIKCNGQTPCQRCGNLNLECIYAPNCCNGFKESQEFKDMSAQIAALQDQVNGLRHMFNDLSARLGVSTPSVGGMRQRSMSAVIDPSLQSPGFQQQSPGATILRPKRGSRRSESQATFRGPTSNLFNLGVAKHSLQTMGITSDADAVVDSGDAGQATREASPADVALMRSHDRPLPFPPPGFSTEKDPIWTVSQEEALRLCRVWEDEMGMMYPVLDMEKVMAYARKLYGFIEAAQRSRFWMPGTIGLDSMDDDDTNILKMVLATAMTVEASGRSEQGQKLFEFVHPAIDRLLLGNVGIKGIRLLVLTAMYEFHRDNEGTSWRIIGMTARLCIELGLHRRETYEAMTDESERSETILLFWAIYVLDRRWSFGTGMPFALQDQDIDPLLPKPEDRSPYLSAMIQYSAIAAKVWRSVVSFSSTTIGTINTEEMGYLDYQVIQWHHSIPSYLRFEHPSQQAQGRLTTPIGPPQSRAASRLRALLYIRANQMRILIYRPVLHSATSIMQHRAQAQTVVDVAKDTIRVLTHINQTSDLYRTQQVLFNAFLTSALAVLFLAVAHTPAEFADSVREEFYMALELVRGFSKGSWISKRLWKTVRVLKELGPQLGLPRSTVEQAAGADMDPNRSAAVAMAGLAGHQVDERALFGVNGQNGGGGINWNAAVSGGSSSPEGMANDLTSLFEAAGGYSGVGMNNGGEVGFEGQGDGLEALAAAFGGDEGLSGILKELF